VHGVNLHESKESRIQSYVSAAGDSLQRLSTVLDESQRCWAHSAGPRPARTRHGRRRLSPPALRERVMHAAKEASAAFASPLHGSWKPCLHPSTSMWPCIGDHRVPACCRWSCLHSGCLGAPGGLHV
jgi:hypothetical protein